jgi:hypothetical protein
MSHSVSIRLDEGILRILEEAARDRGIGLSSYLRELATAEAGRVRR